MNQIVIAQRGWVFVGKVSTPNEHEIVIENARVIRRWGTTNGLGQIAINGPTPNTVMDDYGTVTLHPLAIVARVNCSDKWQF